ncbi:MAG: metallophosphatase family protein [Actinomycetota bacterium]|nr:metallophosphatase family protein [Actinomycetota bacterium]
MRVVALSDTHGPRFWKVCPPTVAEHLRGTDLILHAGDVCVPGVLEELSAFAPVCAVRGNNDGADVAAWGAPEVLELTLDGLAVAMIHDSGPRSGRLARLHQRFPGAGLVVFGHSHVPLDEGDGNLRILNPGSPTDKRRQPHGTIAVLDIADGVLRSASMVAVS